MSGGTTFHVLGEDTLGGCESLSLSLAGELARTGYGRQEVVFLSPLTGVISPRFEAAGIAVHSIPQKSRLGFMAAFLSLCRKRGTDAILTHGFGRHVYTALAASRIPGCKTVALIQNPAPDDRGLRFRTMVYAQLARPFVHRHVACSQYVADSMIAAYRIPVDEIEVVSDWCDVESVRAASSAFDRTANVVGPVIGMVARLDRIKDHDTAIRAFALVRAGIPEARLRLVGDGPLRATLVALAYRLGVGDSVEFLGSRNDVAIQLGALDIFCYATTEQEGFGIVLIEAMAAGVPIVCTEVGPCREVLRDGSAGVLVAPRDPGAMAGALKSLWLDSPRRLSLATAASAIVGSDYSVTAAAARFRRILES